jgi:hypothetical protein
LFVVAGILIVLYRLGRRLLAPRQAPAR